MNITGFKLKIEKAKKELMQREIGTKRFNLLERRLIYYRKSIKKLKDKKKSKK